MYSSEINGEGELRGQLAIPGSPGKMTVKTECVCVCVLTLCDKWTDRQTHAYQLLPVTFIMTYLHSCPTDVRTEKYTHTNTHTYTVTRLDTPLGRMDVRSRSLLTHFSSGSII